MILSAGRAIGFFTASTLLAWLTLLVLAMHYRGFLGDLLYGASEAAELVGDGLPNRLALFYTLFISGTTFLITGMVLVARTLVATWMKVLWGGNTDIIARAIGIYITSIVVGYLLLAVVAYLAPETVTQWVRWFSGLPMQMRRTFKLSGEQYFWAQLIFTRGGPVVLLSMLTARLMISAVRVWFGEKDEE